MTQTFFGDGILGASTLLELFCIISRGLRVSGVSPLNLNTSPEWGREEKILPLIRMERSNAVNVSVDLHTDDGVLENPREITSFLLQIL